MVLLKSPLLLISIAQLCISMGWGLLSPVLPIYIVSFNVSYTVVGLVISAFGISRLFIEIPGGILTDRIGRKPIILFGYSLMTASHLVAGLARTPIELVASRMLIGIGSALMLTASRIYVTEMAPVEQRLRYLSLFQAASSIAGIISPTLGGLVSDIVGIRNVFFISATTSLTGALLALNIKSERGIPQSDEEEGSLSSLNILEIVKDRSVIALSASCFIMFFFFNSIRGTMIPIYGADYLKLSSFEIGLTLSLTSAITLIGLFFFTHLVEDHIGRAMLLPLSFLICSISVLLISLSTNLITLLTLIIPLGVGTSLLQPTPWTMISDHAKPEQRGLTMGIARTIGDIGVIIGPTIVGLLIDLGQPLTVFYLVAGILGLFSILTYVFFRNQR